MKNKLKLDGRRSKVKTGFLLLLFFLFPLSFSVAQLASGTDPEQVADKAVEAWLAREPFNPYAVIGSSSDDIGAACTDLGENLINPAPPAGTVVNFDNRELVEPDLSDSTTEPEPATQTNLETVDTENGATAGEAATQTLEPDATASEPVLSERVYSYPASYPSGQLVIVEAKLSQTAGGWRADDVAIRLDTEQLEGMFAAYSAVQTPLGYGIFTLFSIAFITLVFLPSSFLRRWLTEGWTYTLQHRRTVIFSVALLYGLFALGYMTGTVLPAACGNVFAGLIGRNLDSIGVLDALASGNVARLSSLIFFQNFTFGAFTTTFIPASVLALPAYLFNGARFYFLAIVFGFQGFANFFDVSKAIILFAVELMAYIMVTAGGGMMLLTLIREGFSGFRSGYRKLLMMLPIAALLLIIGAWYEAAVILFVP